VQWFERARFELHPENQPPYNVLFGLLGNEVLAQGGQTVVTGGTGTTPDTCADVPDPVNARIRPSKCVSRGQTLQIDIFGFQPNEHVGFWITTPDGNVSGTTETQTIGERGAIDNIPLETTDLTTGIWTIIFEGTSSGYRSVIYFKIL
jgi:hypothetical protein